MGQDSYSNKEREMNPQNIKKIVLIPSMKK